MTELTNIEQNLETKQQENTRKTEHTKTEESDIQNIDTEKLETARKYSEAVQRKWKRENTQPWEDICSAGEVILRAALEQLPSEEDTSTEAYKIGKKKLSTASELLAAIGARNVHEIVLTKATTIADITFQTEKLITTGSITFTDFHLSKKEFQEKLEAAKCSKKVIKQIVQHRETIKNTLETKQIFLTFVCNNNGTIDEELIHFLQEKESYHSSLFFGEFVKVASTYFASSTDSMLKTVNPVTMTLKELKNLIKNADKLEITGSDKIVLQELYRVKVTEKIKQQTSYALGMRGAIHTLNHSLELMTEPMEEDTILSGVRQYKNICDMGKTAYAMLKFAGKVSGTTMVIAGRTIFLNPVSKQINKKLKQEALFLKNTTTTTIKSTETIKQLEKSIHQTKQKIQQNKKIVALKQKAETIRQTTKTVEQKAVQLNQQRKRITRKIKYKKQKTMRILKKPIQLAFSPINIMSSVFFYVKEFFRKKLVLPIAGAILLFLFLYITLIGISGFTMTLLDKAKEVVFLPSEEMQQLVQYLHQKTETVYQEALAPLYNSPISNKVCYDIPLYCYGSPKSENDPTSEYYHNDGITMDTSLWNGWHISYLDSKGTMIENYTSNIKDILCLATVMMENNATTCEAYKPLVEELWEGMKPIITIKESELYHTIYSTDTFPFDGSVYYCNDTSFYEAYEKAKAEGVCFYDSVVTEQSTTSTSFGSNSSGSGCTYEEWCDLEWHCNKTEHDHTSNCNTKDCSHQCNELCVTECIHIHERNCCSKTYHVHSNNQCYEEKYYREYKCPGHTPLHCSYGYRDIYVYVTLLSKEDVYAGITTPEQTTINYLAPNSLEFTTLENKTATIQYNMNSNSDRKQIQSFFEKGTWDYETHKTFAYHNNSTGTFTCNIPNLNQLHSSAMKEVTHCNGAIEWCDRLYDSDWNELYGVVLDNPMPIWNHQ
mgnify:CR=1 FL=1